MAKLVTLSAHRVDVRLLKCQIIKLSETQQYLLSVPRTAEGWPKAIEGVLNLLAELLRHK